MATVPLTQSGNPESNKPHSFPEGVRHQPLGADIAPEEKDPNGVEAGNATSSRKQLHPQLGEKTNFLVASPYHEQQHLLDLETLDKPNQLLARALTILTAIRADYATAPYTESLNWEAVFDSLRQLSETENYTWIQQRFYVVLFRSVLKVDADLDRLHELDSESHREAVASGGLLKYWFGTRNEKRENLATCVWRSKEDARLGGSGPWHHQARQAGQILYDQIEFTTLELVVGNGVGTWEFRPWNHQA